MGVQQKMILTTEADTEGRGGRGARRRWLYGGAVLTLVTILVAAVGLEALADQAWLDAGPWQAAGSALGTLLHPITGLDPTRLLVAYGYWAVLLFVAIESMGVPFPGETMLLVAAIYAGTTHHLSLPLVILAAAVGAILGDNVGYMIGREGGYRLLRRYGHYVRLDERKVKMGHYLFQRHGGKAVFLGRFVAVLRIWAAFLAGAARMPWQRFLLYNAAGGVVWASVYGVGGYALGVNAHRLGGPLGVATAALAVTVLVGGVVFLRRNERRLSDEAEQALPGPLYGGALPRR